MAQNPIGTGTDEERLVQLHAREDGFSVDVTDPVRQSDVPESGVFAWRYREEGDVDRLVLAPIDDPDEAGALPARELTETDGALWIEVPQPLLADGLGLDTAAYDDDNPLLFKPQERGDGIAVGMGPEGEPGGTAEVAIELVPVRFSDGTAFHDVPLDADGLDSDPVAEAQLAHEGGDGMPRSDTISAPLDAAVVDDVVDAADVPRDRIVGVLETIARGNLVDRAADETSFGPLVVEERVVVGLDEADWTGRVVRELDAADDAALRAAKRAHARQAEELLRASEGEAVGYDDHVPVVIRPAGTAESGS